METAAYGGAAFLHCPLLSARCAGAFLTDRVRSGNIIVVVVAIRVCSAGAFAACIHVVIITWRLLCRSLSNLHIDRSLPFELRAFEAGLQAAVARLEQEVLQVERGMQSSLDRLDVQVR